MIRRFEPECQTAQVLRCASAVIVVRPAAFLR